MKINDKVNQSDYATAYKSVIEEVAYTCIVLLLTRFLFVEAKKTLAAKDTDSFNKGLIDISQKFIHSLQLALGVWLGEHEDRIKPPENFKNFFAPGR